VSGDARLFGLGVRQRPPTPSVANFIQHSPLRQACPCPRLASSVPIERESDPTCVPRQRLPQLTARKTPIVSQGLLCDGSQRTRSHRKFARFARAIVEKQANTTEIDEVDHRSPAQEGDIRTANVRLMFDITPNFAHGHSEKMKSESYLNNRIRRLTNSLQHGWLLLGPNSGPTLGRILPIEFQRVSGVRIPFPPPPSPGVS
jgi:hypothetical protein